MSKNSFNVVTYNIHKGVTGIARRVRVHGALGDRSQKARAVREPHRPVAVGHDRDRRRERRDRLRDRRVDATVHEPRRLLELVAHDHLRPHLRVIVGEHMEPVESIEAVLESSSFLGARLDHAGATIA